MLLIKNKLLSITSFEKVFRCSFALVRSLREFSFSFGRMTESAPLQKIMIFFVLGSRTMILILFLSLENSILESRS